MNATSLYVSTCRLVLQADVEDTNSWTDLYRLVPYLRQSLSCTVCSNLLIEPHTPTETNCQHHVCRSCRGGRKKLKPSCGWCKDYEKYVENVQLRILLQCYKKLCEYLTSTKIYGVLKSPVSSNNTGTTAMGASSLIELIQEGAGFKDEFKSTAGLSKSAYSILPCVYTSSTSTQTQGNVVQSSEAISQNIPESPAIRSVSNGASIYSVMYAGSGNKITIKRKAAATEESGILQHEAESSQQASIAGSVKCISASQASYGTSSQRKSSKSSKSSGSFKKPRSSTTRSKRKGCRCGNATAVPGKLTCCGQRCPCYVESKPCLECRCRGCRNPHTADGLKIRPHIPELHNLQLQISTPLSCDNLSSDPLETVEQCLSPSSTTIQVLNVYSTPRLDIDNVPQSLPAALLVGEDAMPSTGSEAEDSDIQLDV
ncbi:E3 ubiquitin-protein ligase MSL2 isoform X1 [Belonocnema kinseyi]|uniref:E3 ubiquitin-protein ligase MSL2 isoform X1 n=1 Tax=Belonocnema kinseyi TaxID=2817044 RepID=UPI00143D846A|nr:E3 ubiquitin-protein ligase MSL2 isoform X1 [Belonocnema kinseyi]XP_033207829.1 E3 ubiquitin-protein ligase MSL2 isoform X1 [Belonocnema kinseyi]XP_033207830.1 E3 ubiquitin-protein ligase MSL2 isoform X1 [Belonocnema kinseyi]XP_033207831.1 E3 ubiquitin-protein ligase MSL2 isoform X1 [Belonocnema kinseyi]XP_033207832.1 E3 ubiquitin-protein ligase MSL2 isoform X1 [Belonocnema kinseyi]